MGPVEPSIARAVHDPGLLVRRCMRFHDLAIDRPDEGRQLAGDRRGDDGRPLALMMRSGLGGSSHRHLDDDPTTKAGLAGLIRAHPELG